MSARFAHSFSLRILLLALAGLFLLALSLAAPVQAATLPDGFSESQVVSGLDDPTAFAFAPDGRIFVTQQSGLVRVVEGNTLLPSPFTSIPVDDDGERGLLGIALHPDFPTTAYVYVYYTVPGDPPHNRISRFLADGNVAAASGEQELVDLDDLSEAENHNGGAIHFGPDGYLYAGVGDNANSNNAETLTNRLGKILRYDENGDIPADNPFFDGAGSNADEIWAYGLRNPFTFAFQPGTGRMFINDVGDGSWEEINDGIVGSNYGWNTCEGFCAPPNVNFRDPLFAYPHGAGNANGCAITGGAFYNPSTQQFPEDYVGDYFFADLCRGWIHRYDIAGNDEIDFASGISTPVDLHVSADGALYYLARGNGQIWRVTYDSPLTDTPTPTETLTPTATWTHTPTDVPGDTATPTETATATETPTETPTETATHTPTETLAPTDTPTPTETVTPSQTLTPTVTRTPCAVSKPTLFKPPADTVVNKARVRLDWSDEPCADFYRVKLQMQDGSGKQVVVVNLSKYRTQALEAGGQYQFRVIACSLVRCERTKWSKFAISANPKP